ncbi:uncharacterized protein TNCV_1518451 [Trichonephila clavipes]|nr:uncharacterized protein TNCV_1518451 [Trichonephila clavipes]
MGKFRHSFRKFDITSIRTDLGQNSDTLEIDSESLKFDEKEKITKRKILSLVSRVFDPIGFLAPVMIQPKILLQATWKTKEAWDDEVNDEIRKTFLKWGNSS